MKYRRIMAAFLTAAFFFVQFLGQGPKDVLAGGPGEELIGRKVDAGYFDIWRHADGKTWQDTDGDGVRDMPGQEKITDLYIVIPEEYRRDYRDIRYEVVTSFGREEYEAAGGYIDWSEGGRIYGFGEYYDKIIKYTPDQYYLVSGNKVHLKLNGPEGVALKIKKSWQGKLVEGWRYYLPFIVYFYGVPKNPPPLDPPNPPVVITPPALPPPPPPEPNAKPVARFTVSKKNPAEGESISVSNTSYHPNWPKESIVSYRWTIERHDGVSYSDLQHPGSFMWPKAGTYDVILTVRDGDGETDTYSERISVSQAVPVAVIDAPKQAVANREVNISGDRSYSPGFDDIVRENNSWEIYRPDGTLAWSGRQRYPKNDPPPDNIFNIPGNWRVRLQVEDEDGTRSEWEEKLIEVLPDNPPETRFSLPEKSVRYAVDNYEITAVSDSVPAAPDRYFGEEIFRHEWKLYYDSDNNGTYDITILPNTANSHAYLSVKSENDPSPKIRAYKTGRFKLELRTQERYYGWGTWREGLMSGWVSREFMVENLAPTGTFETEPVRNAEIVFVVDGVENQQQRVLSVQNNLAAFRQRLLNNNIKATVRVVEVPKEHPWPQAGHDQYRSAYNGYGVIPPYNMKNYNIFQYLSCDEAAISNDGIIVRNGGRDRDVKAYNLKDSKQIWSFTTDGECNEPPAIYGNTVYQADRAGALYALDLKTGALKWKKQYSDESWDIAHVVVDKNGYVYKVSMRYVHKYDQAGNLIWRKGGQGAYYVYSVVDDDGNVYGINYAYYYQRASFWGLDHDGNRKFLIDENCAGFAVDESFIYLAGAGGLRKLDKNGNILDVYPVSGNEIIVKGDYLYVSSNGVIYKVHKNSKEIIWQINGIGSYVKPTITDDKILVTYVVGWPRDLYFDVFDINTGEQLHHMYIAYMGYDYSTYFTRPFLGNNGKGYIKYGSSSLVEIGDPGISGSLPKLAELQKNNTWGGSDYRFVVSVADAPYSDINMAPQILADLENKGANLIVAGRSGALQTQAGSLFNRIEGAYIQGNTDMSGPMTEIAEYIVQNINGKTGGLSNVVLVNEEVIYRTQYFDFEEDPKLDEYWHFRHDSTKVGSYALSNGQGLDYTVHDKTVDNPFKIFSKPGNYLVKYYVRDNIPFAAYRNHSQAGNRWSDPPERKIVVHRRPVAVFSFQKDRYRIGETVTITDDSYDPDLQHTDLSGHKGINARYWRYRHESDTQWTTSGAPPLSFNKPGNWYVGLQVRDVHGALSEWRMEQVFVENAKPVAKFVPVPKKAGPGQEIYLLDYSHDPDGDEITEWEYVVEGKGTYTVPCPVISYDTPGVRWITLRVKDEFGEWSEPYSASVEIINVPNRPPVARFNPTPNPVPVDTVFNYNETSYDPDGGGIITKIWYIKAPGSEHEEVYYDGNQPDRFAVPGDYVIGLEVEDDTGLWSERETKVLAVADPLKITGSSNKDTYHAAEAMILSAVTEGGAYKVEARMWWSGGNDFENTNVTELVPQKSVAGTPPDRNDWVTRHNVLGNDYDRVVIIPRDMPDGTYQVRFTAYKRRQDGSVETATDTITVRVQGHQFNRLRTRIISDS
jgi:hypothetical protein